METSRETCRICLNYFKSKINAISVFETDEKSFTIAEKIYDISGVHIEASQNLPEKICNTCNGTLEIAYNFRLTCLESEKKLKSIDEKKDIIVNPVDIKPESTCYLDENDYDDYDDNDIMDVESLFDKKILDDNKILLEKNFLNIEVVSPEKINNSFCSEIEINDKNFKEESECNVKITCDEILDKTATKSQKRKTTKTKGVDEIPEKSKNHNRTSKRKYFVQFNMTWLEMHEWIKPAKEKTYAYCTICESDFSIGHGGKFDITRHSKTSLHLQNSDPSYILEKKFRGSDGRVAKKITLNMCEICGNTYQNKSLLNKHLKYHSNILEYECEICKKKFRDASQVKRHIRVHTGEKPYECSFCAKKFGDLSTKIKHERVHKNERPYVCQTCGKSFTYTYTLSKHILIHTGEKPFGCSTCNTNFARKTHLQNHLQSMLHKSRLEKKMLN